MRKLADGLLVAAGLVLGYFLWQEHADRIRAEAVLEPLRAEAAEARRQAQERDDSLRAVRLRAEELQAALGASAALNERLSAGLAAAVAETEVIVNVAVTDLGAILAEIRTHLPEAAAPLVDSAAVRVTALSQANQATALAFRDEAARFTSFRTESALALEAMELRATTAEASSLDWQRVAAVEAARAAAAERLATPGVWSRVRNSLPLFSVQGTVAGLVGLAAGVAVSR